MMAHNKRSAPESNALRAGRKRGRQATDQADPADQSEASTEEAANVELGGPVIEEDAEQAPNALGDRRAGWAAAARRYISMLAN